MNPPTGIVAAEALRDCHSGNSGQKKNALIQGQGNLAKQNGCALEQVPQELVVDVVVILHLGRFDKSSEQTRTAVRRRLLQVCVASLHVFTEKLRRPVRFAEVR